MLGGTIELKIVLARNDVRNYRKLYNARNIAVLSNTLTMRSYNCCVVYKLFKPSGVKTCEKFRFSDNYGTRTTKRCGSMCLREY